MTCWRWSSRCSARLRRSERTGQRRCDQLEPVRLSGIPAAEAPVRRRGHGVRHIGDPALPADIHPALFVRHALLAWADAAQLLETSTSHGRAEGLPANVRPRLWPAANHLRDRPAEPLLRPGGPRSPQPAQAWSLRARLRAAIGPRARRGSARARLGRQALRRGPASAVSRGWRIQDFLTDAAEEIAGLREELGAISSSRSTGSAGAHTKTSCGSRQTSPRRFVKICARAMSASRTGTRRRTRPVR